MCQTKLARYDASAVRRLETARAVLNQENTKLEHANEQLEKEKKALAERMDEQLEKNRRLEEQVNAINIYKLKKGGASASVARAPLGLGKR